MKRIIFFIFFVFAGLALRAQNTPVHPLNIGDTVPDKELILHIGDSTTHIHLKDLRGKLVIFDYWDEGCPVCIEAMPRMLQLQKKFGDKIKIIVLDSYPKENSDNYKILFKKRAPFYRPSVLYAASHLPVIFDTTFNAMFPIRCHPEHLWIDANGVFKALTYGDATTAETVEGLLSGKKIYLADARIKQGFYYVPSSWMLHTADFQGQPVRYLASFSGSINGGGGWYDKKIFTRTKLTGLVFTNQSILDIYRFVLKGKYGKSVTKWGNDQAYNFAEFSDRILLEVNNPFKYRRELEETKYSQWQDINSYCYAIKLQDSNRIVNIYNVLQQELDRNFDLVSEIKTVKVKCFVVKRTSNEDKLRSKGGIVSSNIIFGKTESLDQQVFTNMPFSECWAHLIEPILMYFKDTDNNYLSERPIVLNETGYADLEYVDMQLPVWSDENKCALNDLNSALQKYSLHVYEEYRMRQMLVIREKNYDPTAMLKQ